MLRSLLVVSCLSIFGASACAAPPPTPAETPASAPAPVAAPAAAAPAPAAAPRQHAAPAPIEDAFRVFAGNWMVKLRRLEDPSRGRPSAQGAGHTYRNFSSDFAIETRKTRFPDVPFVGILHYEEIVYRCADAARVNCQVAQTVPVAEVFRYQGGRWSE